MPLERHKSDDIEGREGGREMETQREGSEGQRGRKRGGRERERERERGERDRTEYVDSLDCTIE